MDEEKKVVEEAYEEKLDIDLGSEDNFFVANNGNYFGIAFDKLFGQPQLAIYNTFEMSSKRNFKNLTPSLLDTYKELFLDENGELNDECELIFFNILKTKSDIMVSENNISYEQFIAYMENIMSGGDNLLIKIIDKFVEDHYALELDKATEDAKDKKRKVNEELQFSDSHAKDLLKIAYLYRVMIPIISIYFTYNKGSFNSVKESIIDEETGEAISEEEAEEIEFDEVNSSIFAYLFDKFATNPEALRNKLYRLTYSGVSKTNYSDKRFWLAAKNVAITDKTEALDIYKKLLTNAIPKLSIESDKNVVSFLQSVINNQVDFLFKNKFKYHFVPIGNEGDGISTEDSDDSNMTEFERIEILQTRKDEGSYIIRKKNIEEVLERIPEKLDVGVSDAEVKDMMTKITRNSVQEQIIAIMTFKYFNDKDALKYVSFYQYCYLLIACKKYLIEHKFIYLPLILTATCEKHRERVSVTGKKVKPQILDSKKYKDLVEKRYTSFADEIEKPFLSFVGTVYSSVFKNADGEEIFDSTIKVGKIAEEIVNLIDYTM
jgi:hypothetical protein